MPYEGDDKALDVPAIVGIGGSLLYFVETYGAKGSAYDAEFDWLGERDPQPEGVGFYYLDHLTHNVYPRQHGQVVGFLPQSVQFQADPLLRHRRAHHRSGQPRHHLALRQDPHSARTNRRTTRARSRNF